MEVKDKVLELKQGKSSLKGYKTNPRKGPNISESIWAIVIGSHQ